MPSTDRPTPRRRRPPERARAELLAAAEALAVERGPDAVTLAAVARAVGVTAGLVTHYFGTRDALLREVLGKQDALTRRRVRAALRAGTEAPDADVLLRVLFEALSEPTRVRLFVWAHLRGDFERGSSGGLRALVDELEARFRSTLPPRRVPPRSRIESVVLLALAAIHGWAVGKRSWLEGLGLGAPAPERDREFLAALTAVLRDLMSRPVRGQSGEGYLRRT